MAHQDYSDSAEDLSAQGIAHHSAFNSENHSQPPAGGAVGTLTSALAKFWGPAAAEANQRSGASGSSMRPRDATPGSRVASSSAFRLPGGWGTGYFSRGWGRSASTVSNQTDATFVDARDDFEPAQEPSPVHRTSRASSNHRKRSAIPFERSPAHSRDNSDCSALAPPDSPPFVGMSPPGSLTSSPAYRGRTLKLKPSDSAISSLTRLKAQSSIQSLRSNSFDNSFGTVSSNMAGRWADERDREGDTAAYEPSHLHRQQRSKLGPAAVIDPSSDETPVEASIRPGAPPPRDWKEALARTALLGSYVQSIVFQSGIDLEGRPIVVLASAALPDPKEVDYDALLTRIMDQMELFVQNDYTVILFAGGSTHRPPWSWIWSAYRRLSRPFRKNCRKLYICHPTFFTRSLVQIIATGSAVLSPKFVKKITQVNTLSQLATHLDLTRIDIPPEVLKWNMRYEKEVIIPPPADPTSRDEDMDVPAHPNNDSKVFGVPLELLMGEKGEKGGIPRVVKDCVEELQRLVPSGGSSVPNFDTEGIFRKSPSTALLQAAQQAYDRGNPVSLSQYNDPNIPAGLLKLFFRSLPEPIFPASLYPLIRSCPSFTDDNEDSVAEAISYIRGTLLPAIVPESKLILLSYVLEVVHKASRHAQTNKMDASNLATVWAPNLVKSSDPMKDIALCAVAGAATMKTGMAAPVGSGFQSLDSASSSNTAGTPSGTTTLGTIIKLCIERYYEVFEFDFMDYEPPIYHPEAFEVLDEQMQQVEDGQHGPSTPPPATSRRSSLAQRTPASLLGSRFSSPRPIVNHTRSVSAATATTIYGSPEGSFTADSTSPTAMSPASGGSTGGGAAPQGPQTPARAATISSPTRSASRSVSAPRPLPSPSGRARDGQSLHSGNGGSAAGGGLGLGFGPMSAISSAKGLGNPMAVGRSASGSLRLTKARLGSGSITLAGASGSPAGNASFGQGLEAFRESAQGDGSPYLAAGGLPGPRLSPSSSLTAGLAGAGGAYMSGTSLGSDSFSSASSPAMSTSKLAAPPVMSASATLPSTAPATVAVTPAGTLGVVGTTSGVTLTGASASGWFTTSGSTPAASTPSLNADKELPDGEDFSPSGAAPTALGLDRGSALGTDAQVPARTRETRASSSASSSLSSPGLSPSIGISLHDTDGTGATSASTSAASSPASASASALGRRSSSDRLKAAAVGGRRPLSELVEEG